MSLRHIWAGSQQTGGVDCQTSLAAASHGQAPGPNLSPHKVKESGGQVAVPGGSFFVSEFDECDICDVSTAGYTCEGGR